MEVQTQHERQRQPQAHRYPEGPVATAIERETAKLPSDLFLWAAGGSIAVSLALKLNGRDRDALFVGQWAPTFLLLGLYNKMVKIMGTDDRDASGDYADEAPWSETR